MSVDYRFVLSDASSGANIAELETFSVSGTIPRMLNGVGTMTGVMPIDDPKASTANLDGDREITVYRDDSAIWNGPITNHSSNLQSRQTTITVREASWYLYKRTLEVASSTLWTNPADLFNIVRALVTYAKTKTDGGSINAGLPRFNVSPASALAGHTKSYTYFGSARHLISQILEQLTEDPTAGIDWKMDYATGSTRQSCQRTLTLGYPSLGSTLPQTLTEAMLFDLTVEHDRERAANRVHGLGQNAYTKTYQNTGSVAAGDILIEEVYDATNKNTHSGVDDFTRDARRLAQPPVKSVSFSHVPGGALPFGWADLGDTATINTNLPGPLGLAASSHRIVQIDVTPPSGDSPEVEAYTTNLPLDQLGA